MRHVLLLLVAVVSVSACSEKKEVGNGDSAGGGTEESGAGAGGLSKISTGGTSGSFTKSISSNGGTFSTDSGSASGGNDSSTGITSGGSASTGVGSSGGSSGSAVIKGGSASTGAGSSGGSSGSAVIKGGSTSTDGGSTGNTVVNGGSSSIGSSSTSSTVVKGGSSSIGGSSTGGTTVSFNENPFKSQKLYVDPNHNARNTANNWSTNGRSEDAEMLRKIYESAQSPRYLQEWTEQPENDGIEFYANYYSTLWAKDGSLPVLGAYAIPHRDCGSYSAGGFATAAQYQTWIDGFARGIGDKKVVVVLEPDGLAAMDCLSAADQDERVALLKYAIRSLKSKPRAFVYIDVGHSKWRTANVMIDRLKRVGIEVADGFTLNSANFNTTDSEVAYGTQISQGVGGKHFIVDTSRNGLGPYTGGTHDGDCAPQFNPPGRALGSRPTGDTGFPLVDAFYWLKSPGASDANCGGFPAAGKWEPEYALGLASRALW
jgi:endoglucanase